MHAHPHLPLKQRDGVSLFISVEHPNRPFLDFLSTQEHARGRDKNSIAIGVAPAGDYAMKSQRQLRKKGTRRVRRQSAFGHSLKLQEGEEISAWQIYLDAYE